MPHKSEQEMGENQKTILRFIKEYHDNRGHSPSVSEIMLEMGISSISVVNDYLAQMERAGYIEQGRFGIKLTGLISSREVLNNDRKLRVFICHAKEDKEVVRELYQRLLAEGWIDPWLDEEKLLPGQDWDMEIEKAVEAADAVIVFLSNHSVTKEGYIQRELRKVLDVADEKPEGAICVVPVRVDDVQIPRRLKIWQYVDFFPSPQIKTSFVRLIASLRKRAEETSIPIPTVSSLDEDIVLHILAMDEWGNIIHNGYFLTKPNALVGELLTNFKNDYPDVLTAEIDEYKIDLEISLNDFVNDIEMVNEAVLTIRPR